MNSLNMAVSYVGNDGAGSDDAHCSVCPLSLPKGKLSPNS